MKYIITLLGIIPTLLFGQSNDCSTATNLPVTLNCSTPTNGTTVGATESFAGCAGSADDDVWYQFTATSANHTITVTPSATMDPVVQVLSGTCASLTSLVCRDNGFAGEAETVSLQNLTIGQVYKVRVYGYGLGSGGGTFSICCVVGPSPPANNNCASAGVLPVNVACVNTAGTTNGATNTGLVGCVGNADDDVWYSFTASNAVNTITVTPTTTGIDLVAQLYSGTCAGLLTEFCVDNGLSDDPEVINGVGLTPGQVYFVRVHDYYAGVTGNFNICVSGPATSAPTNDEPCNAIQLPAVTSDCNYLEFTTIGATATATPGAPSSCVGGSAPQQGGYAAGTKDVWFKVTVPASGKLTITPKPNMPVGRISDGVMALYTGTCGALTQVACSDDNNYPGAINDDLPLINATGLTPGATVYVRFFGWGTTSGTFGLCITTTSNDACSNALYICDLNGYSASTSPSYTADRPCNMFGNNETNAGVDQPNGTNTGGIFGSAGSWGTGSPFFDVNINNNSWIRFTASAASATLAVSVIDCWVGNYPSGGIQMQIFSSTGGCCNFVPVSNFQENSTGFTITANGLTVGNDYYLMVDGFAGDICNYTISAQSGVQFPQITPVAPICAGSSVTLNAPPGGTSYDWFHNGSTSQSVNVTPGSTQTYSVDVYGLCGNKQTLTTTVTIKPKPLASVGSSTISVCAGQTINLTATTVVGATYSWTGPNSFTSSQQNPSILNAGTLNAGVYTLTVTLNGCVSNPVTTTVIVNALPTAPVVASAFSVCVGQPINLTAGGSVLNVYSWTGPAFYASLTQNPTRPNAITSYSGTYFVTATALNGCTSPSSSVNVTVNNLPTAVTASSSTTSICTGSNIVLNATQANASGTFSWTGPNGFTSSSQNPTISSATTAATGTYSVIYTENGCSTASAGTVNVTVNAIPSAPVITSSNTVCQGGTISLTATAIGGQTYAWTGPNNYNGNTANSTVANANAINAGVYTVTTTVNGCTSAGSTINVSVNTPATSNAGGTISSCNGGSVALNGIVGGSAASGVWSGGSGTFSNVNSLTSSYTPTVGEVGTGSVILTLTSNDPIGPCPAVASTVTLNISSSPSAIFSYPNATYCQSATDPTPVFPMGSSAGTFTSTLGLSIATNGTIDVSASTPGTYTVTNNIAASGSCPAANSNTAITINATPTSPIASSTALICVNGTIALNATNVVGATYSWTGPNSFSSGIQNPSFTNATLANSGIYSVTATVNGCPSVPGTVNVSITPNPVLVVTPSNTISFCANGTALVSASGANTYLWSTGETTNEIVVNSSTPSSITITGTTNGCSTMETVSLTLNPLAVINGTPVLTNTNCSTPTGSISAVNITGIPTLNYVWKDDLGNTIGSTADISNLGTGNYTLFVLDGNNCQTIFGPYQIVNLPTPSSPVITSSGSITCENGSVTLTTNPSALQTVSWTGPGGFTSTSNQFTLSPVSLGQAGNYCATITQDGCSSLPTCELISVNPLPVVAIGALGNDTVACVNETIQLIASGSTNYSWSGPNGFTSSSNPLNINGTSINQSGYYVVTTTNGQSCVAKDSVLISVFPLPVINFSSNANANNLYCEGTNATFAAIGGNTYLWTGPNGFSSSNDTVTFQPINYTNNGNYFINMTDFNGCSNTDTFQLNVQSPNFGQISGNPVLCPNATLNLIASGGVTYSWFGPSFTSSDSAINIPNFTATNAGWYNVIITNANGCVENDSILTSISYGASCILIPELVTPDGDGHNDAWEIEGLDNFPNAEVFIFNRWGNLTYQVSPYTTPWKGEINKGTTIDGNDGLVPVGTYFYLIKLHDADETEYKGYLELQKN